MTSLFITTRSLLAVNELKLGAVGDIGLPEPPDEEAPPPPHDEIIRIDISRIIKFFIINIRKVGYILYSSERLFISLRNTITAIKFGIVTKATTT